MKKFFKDYFTFSRKESYVAIAILIITTTFILFTYYYAAQEAKQPIDASLAKMASQKLLQKDSLDKENLEDEKPYSKTYENNYATQQNRTITPFEFDPNTISEDGWHKLGLSDKVVKTIINYRSKGGSFRNAEDIRKIWGLKKEDADILVPYITIANKQNATTFNSNFKNKLYEKNVPTIVEINTATAEDFKRLPAVGNIAYRIVKYREKLGGFISLSQIKETIGLSDSVYQAMEPYLKLSSTNIQKININTSTDFDLSKHPYISNDIAKAIVIYRKQHGNYAKIEEVKKIVFINQTMFQKFAPYITVEE